MGPKVESPQEIDARLKKLKDEYFELDFQSTCDIGVAAHLDIRAAIRNLEQQFFCLNE